ncbi:hypothetical protein ENSA5_51700 [Enhygromyxa salina]|uniref:Uncharacterized protein n=1 Tax=Enhygromyxa salina TaxID=215803 RepID=A0A2S9XGS6_9BACT|nr:hypothetical protein [Enhygromyxa salina]PRP92076.1 hypothetical protein ENSA5_51700 [Enhygromyxa salina]
MFRCPRHVLHALALALPLSLSLFACESAEGDAAKAELAEAQAELARDADALHPGLLG